MINLPRKQVLRSHVYDTLTAMLVPGASGSLMQTPYLVTVIIWPNIMQIFLLRGILWREALPSSQQGKKLNLLSIRKIIAWVDPSEELIYVFLSNCLQSSAKINLLSELSVSLKIQDVIYQSIVKSQIIPYFLAWLLPSVKD